MEQPFEPKSLTHAFFGHFGPSGLPAWVGFGPSVGELLKTGCMPLGSTKQGGAITPAII